MPYDPNFPTANTVADAVQVRAQFAGLKALIDAVPAIASASVDTVTTLDPGDSASADAAFDGTALRFTFRIPRGGPGGPGPDGAQGPPGEVTAAALAAAIDAAIAGTPRNPDALGAFGGGFSDPPTQAEMQAFAAYVESLRTALLR